MKFQIRFLGALLGSVLLVSCANKAQKDLYFRARLPTIEEPDLNPPKSLGANLQVQSARFKGKLTENLAEKFQFKKSDGEFGNRGLDLSLTYAEKLAEIPFQLQGSFDQAKLKVGLFDLRETQGIGFFASGFYAYSSTPVEVEDGSCKTLFCNGRDPAEVTLENSISAGGHGTEQKVGVSLGYTFAPKHSIYVGTSWQDARLVATASQNGTYLDFYESYYGSGNGVGYLYRQNSNFKVSVAADDVKINWNDRVLRQTIYSLTLDFAGVFR